MYKTLTLQFLWYKISNQIKNKINKNKNRDYWRNLDWDDINSRLSQSWTCTHFSS